MRSTLTQSGKKTGLWLIGAGGNIAATVAIGLHAIQRKLASPIGLVTELPELRRLSLVPISAITLGGHEVRKQGVTESARDLHLRSGLFSESLLRKLGPQLGRFQRNIRPGTSAGAGRAVKKFASAGSVDAGKSGRSIIDRLRKDLRNFKKRNRLDRVVVINVASTEPLVRRISVGDHWAKLDASLAKTQRPAIPASSLYAIAAIEELMPFVNFTPSVGADLPAIRELADRQGVPIMGSDGKTGETLLKSVLAPMFVERNLEILSWDGHNILGNLDGRVLADPDSKASKLKSKGNVVGSIVGYEPQTPVSIEYVESLHDWKIAWDHIHFRGFLGTRMSVQFTWQGSDSILAAPLIIDLARLADFHAAQGLGGAMTHLGCFFKSPMDVDEHRFSGQVNALHRYVAEHSTRRGARR
ncbi:MAG: inositol-3-phosphate synthase [Planctomycetota bacterium]|nr:inositol-3-phosphate synthase [Planctomycetota bacterium]